MKKYRGEEKRNCATVLARQQDGRVIDKFDRLVTRLHLIPVQGSYVLSLNTSLYIDVLHYAGRHASRVGAGFVPGQEKCKSQAKSDSKTFVHYILTVPLHCYSKHVL